MTDSSLSPNITSKRSKECILHLAQYITLIYIRMELEVFVLKPTHCKFTSTHKVPLKVLHSMSATISIQQQQFSSTC